MMKRKSSFNRILRTFGIVVGIVVGIVTVCYYILKYISEREAAREPELSFYFDSKDYVDDFIILNMPGRLICHPFQRLAHGWRQCKFEVRNGPKIRARDIILRIDISRREEVTFQISAAAIYNSQTNRWLTSEDWDLECPEQKEWKSALIRINEMTPNETLEVYCLFVHDLPKPPDRMKADKALGIELKCKGSDRTEPVRGTYDLYYEASEGS